MNARPETNGDRALAYARHGWPVFPVIPGEKVPATKHGLLDATTDPDQITWWWSRSPGRNIGIATGTPGPDVVDVDVRESGSGFSAWNRLVREGVAGKPLAVIRTPSGGLHAYYQGTAQRNGHIAEAHVDFRSRGGYVVAPPSIVGGNAYVVVRHGPSDAVVDWQAVRKLLEPEADRSLPAMPGDGPRNVAHLAQWVAELPEGNRNAGLYWAACRAAEARDVPAMRAIAIAAERAGLPTKEIARTIRSAQQTARTARPFDLEAG